MIAAFASFVTSCIPDPVPEITTTIYGVAKISKNPVNIGDEAELSVHAATFGERYINAYGDTIIGSAEGIYSVSGGIVLNGKTYGIPRIFFYIDEEEVGSSTDKDNNFAIKCKIENLEIGDHVLRVEAEPQEKSTTIKADLLSTIFSVVAAD